MATITNPASIPLRCDVLKRLLEPGETVEVAESVAAAVTGTVFVVEHGHQKAGHAEKKTPVKKAATVPESPEETPAA